MYTIEFNRDDLFKWCRKINMDLVSLNSHIDFDRLKEEKKLSNHDCCLADIVYFTDDDGSKKVLRRNRRKYR